MARGSIITSRDLECMLCDETAEPQALPLSLLEQITDGFSDEQKIGHGGFAVVYKAIVSLEGKLQNRTVAVKRMSNACMDEKVFHREVQCLMMAKHKNIVRFLGYCADRQGSMQKYEGNFVMADVHQRLLCFEYLPKGSLHEYITDASSGLRWRDRYQIIMGICQGLHYLHQEHIVQLDLKPANILLDDNWVPKITDFGISRCFHEIQSQVLTKIAGTPGYLAPESFNHTEVTYRHSYRLDIYSLGVVIIEILTGEKGYHDVDKVVESWSNMLEKSHIEVEQKQVRLCAEIGIECTNFNPTKRPDTQHIINRLKETESVDEYVEIGVLTSHQLVQKDLVFTVKNEQGYKLNQLRDLNNLQGSLEISGLENVTSMEEALEANLAAKKGLAELILKWDSSSTRCSPEVEADVLEGLCPPVGLKELKISVYDGSRYPNWMVGKQNGGPKDLQELNLFTVVEGPAPQIVEAFPHLRVLSLHGGNWDALPSNMEHLTSLKKLAIGWNDNIRSLPTLPRSLEEFRLSHCDHKFMKSCQKVRHPNWQKIEHIPEKTFNEISTLARMQLKLEYFWIDMTT